MVRFLCSLDQPSPGNPRVESNLNLNSGWSLIFFPVGDCIFPIPLPPKARESSCTQHLLLSLTWYTVGLDSLTQFTPWSSKMSHQYTTSVFLMSTCADTRHQRNKSQYLKIRVHKRCRIKQEAYQSHYYIKIQQIRPLLTTCVEFFTDCESHACQARTQLERSSQPPCILAPEVC